MEMYRLSFEIYAPIMQRMKVWSNLLFQVIACKWRFACL